MDSSWLEKEIFGMKDHKQKIQQHQFTVGKALANPKKVPHPVKELAIGFNDWVRKLRSILHIPRAPIPVLPAKNQTIHKNAIGVPPVKPVDEQSIKQVKEAD